MAALRRPLLDESSDDETLSLPGEPLSSPTHPRRLALLLSRFKDGVLYHKNEEVGKIVAVDEVGGTFTFNIKYPEVTVVKD